MLNLNHRYIYKKLAKKGYNHYEVSNFSKEGKESIHNLTYWNNEEYYGFGLGACGYLHEVRYENTKSMTKYLAEEYMHTRELVPLEDEKKNKWKY